MTPGLSLRTRARGPSSEALQWLCEHLQGQGQVGLESLPGYGTRHRCSTGSPDPPLPAVPCGSWTNTRLQRRAENIPKLNFVSFFFPCPRGMVLIYASSTVVTVCDSSFVWCLSPSSTLLTVFTAVTSWAGVSIPLCNQSDDRLYIIKLFLMMLWSPA